MKKYLLYLMMLGMALTMTSCLKDNPVENREYGILIEDLETKKIIELKGLLPRNEKTNLITMTKSVLTDAPTREVELCTIHLAAKDVAQEDIVVNLKATHDGVAADQRFPLGSINIPATVTIPKGERDVVVKATVNTNDVTGEGAAINLIISGTVQQGYTVSGNFGQVVLYFKERSIYEGTYRYELLENTAYPTYTGYFLSGDEEYQLLTEGKYIVHGDLFYGLWGDQIFFEFDPETNLIVSGVVPSWDNWTVDPSASKYDATSKSYTVKVMNKGNNGRYIVLKLTRLD